MKGMSGVPLGLAILFPVLVIGNSSFADEKGKRCTKTSVSCYDSKTHQARTCVTETCTFADGHTTTSVTVEMVGGGGGGATGTRKPLHQVPSGAIQKAN
jgi:hypothetical protein